MAASQRQMQTYIHFRNSYTFYISYPDVIKGDRIFVTFLSNGFGEKCKHTELASNFVQKQYFN